MIEAPGLAPASLGLVVADGGAEIDQLLADCADRLARAGWRIGGLTQANIAREGQGRCAMSLTDLMSGEVIGISQDLGEGAGGCALDPEAFARASLRLDVAIAAKVELLIVNKFGKQEAEGRGLRGAIAEALLAGIPVLTTVSRLNLDACQAFAGGAAEAIAPHAAAVLAWCGRARPVR